MTILKLILFIISNLGQWQLIHHKWPKINISFLPGITIAIQTTVLFFAGLFNALLEVVFCIYFTGLVCFGIIMYRDKGIRFLKDYIDSSYLYLGISLLAMGLALKGKIFTHNDNFSHWALVVKQMLENNRFPNLLDNVIMFTDYPLGSSVYIYYCASLINTSESIQMLAQVYIMLASMMSMFSLSKKNRRFAILPVLLLTNYFFVYNISVTDLLVDTLLPLVAMSALLYILSYCKALESEQVFFPIVFYLIQITQIKNSGLFFVIYLSAIILYHLIKQKKHKTLIACLLIPFLTRFLWSKHCEYVYISSDISKHAMSLVNYIDVFSLKSPESITEITKSLIKFILSWKDLYVTVGLFLVVFILIWVFYRDSCEDFRKLLFLAILLFLTYQLGILGMYLFSMPGEEAMTLAGVVRYDRTIIIALLYLVMIPILDMISKMSNKTIICSITAVIMSLSILTHMKITRGKIIVAGIHSTSTSPAKRNWVETVKTDYQIPNGESYAILTSESDSGYMYFICKYVFFSNEVKAYVVDSTHAMDAISEKYILLYDEQNEIARNWIEEHFPDQAGLPVVITR